MIPNINSRLLVGIIIGFSIIILAKILLLNQLIF